MPELGEKRPEVPNIDKAEFWIGVLWHWSVKDAERMRRLEDRVAYLEQPWWRRVMRRKR